MLSRFKYDSKGLKIVEGVCTNLISNLNTRTCVTMLLHMVISNACSWSYQGFENVSKGGLNQQHSTRSKVELRLWRSEEWKWVHPSVTKSSIYWSKGKVNLSSTLPQLLQIELFCTKGAYVVECNRALSTATSYHHIVASINDTQAFPLFDSIGCE